MAVYGVVMGQAISMADLGDDVLMTGQGDTANLLRSCSAIIFFNQRTRAAALYHYPAGDITRRPNARELIGRIADAVQPTGGCIVYGTNRTGETYARAQGEPDDPYHFALRDHVQGLLDRVELRLMPTLSGLATFRWNNGNPEVGVFNEYMHVQDLGNDIAGRGNYVLYRAHDDPHARGGCGCMIL